MITQNQMDRIFKALSHAIRRRIMDLVKATPGQSVGELATHFDVSRIAIMNHLSVLEEADLIISRRDGKSRRLYLNAVPLQLIHERWMTDYSAHWAGRLTSIKYGAEAKSGQKGEI